MPAQLHLPGHPGLPREMRWPQKVTAYPRGRIRALMPLAGHASLAKTVTAGGGPARPGYNLVTGAGTIDAAGVHPGTAGAARTAGQDKRGRVTCGT